MTASAPRRSFRQRHPRHPAEVTADRLAEALEKWPDAFDGRDADMISQIIHILQGIAEHRDED